MNWLHAQMALLDMVSGALRFAVNWLLQSTLLIAAGLALGQLMRRRGAAVQSVVYRTTLIAVLVCPVTTWLLSLAGVSGWSIKMPAAWTYEQMSEPLVTDTGAPVTESAIPAVLPRESSTAPAPTMDSTETSIPVEVPTAATADMQTVEASTVTAPTEN